MRSIWTRAMVSFAAAATLGAMLVVLTPTAGAAAAGPTVVAGLTITPTITTVGTTVQVTATATNTGAATVQASLGINNYGGVHVSAVAGSPGCSPRNLTNLV